MVHLWRQQHKSFYRRSKVCLAALCLWDLGRFAPSCGGSIDQSWVNAKWQHVRGTHNTLWGKRRHYLLWKWIPLAIWTSSGSFIFSSEGAKGTVRRRKKKGRNCIELSYFTVLETNTPEQTEKLKQGLGDFCWGVSAGRCTKIKQCVTNDALKNSYMGGANKIHLV